MASAAQHDLPAAAPPGAPAQSEWRANWRLLLAAIIGAPVPVAMAYMLGQFLVPLEQEFGWTRAEASIGFSVSLLLGFVVSPFVGRVVDRTNARLLALPGIVLTGLAISAFSLATESLALWIALWCGVSLVGALVSPTVWLAVVAGAFEKNRALAISLTLSGMSLAIMFAPLSARLMIDGFGWRMAFPLLGLLWCGPALVLALLFFFDHRPASRPRAKDAAPAVPQPALRQVFLTATFIRMALALTTIGLAASAYGFHLSPALMDKGMDGTTAAAVAGILGLAGIPGKLLLGSLFDRIGQAAVTTGVMALFVIASVILAQDSVSTPLAIAGCIVLGLASGGLSVTVACLIARLFDGSIFGVIYGSLMSLSTIAAAAGPLIISAIHDATGSYNLAFWLGTGIAAIAALLLLGLKPVSLGKIDG